MDSIAFGALRSRPHRADARRVARDLLVKVGLNPDLFGERYPHELSGGQRQRVNIARALAIAAAPGDPGRGGVGARQVGRGAGAEPAGRPASSEFDLTYLFISHDLNVVQYISDRVLVMYLGQSSRSGRPRHLHARPLHPYTRALLGSRPSMDPRTPHEEPPITGDPPNPIDPPAGCRFHTRCPFAEEVCIERAPELGALADARHPHVAACHMLRAGLRPFEGA